MTTREQNERKFVHWNSLPGGGRRYSYEVKGRHRWTARYVKEVDANERTVRFFQEIVDESGSVVERHNKFPKDEGHQKI